MIRTKKELLRVYREQKSLNRLTDPTILRAINEIDLLVSRGLDISKSDKNVIEVAYYIQTN